LGRLDASGSVEKLEGDRNGLDGAVRMFVAMAVRM